jgi:hypothetical protein
MRQSSVHRVVWVSVVVAAVVGVVPEAAEAHHEAHHAEAAAVCVVHHQAGHASSDLVEAVEAGGQEQPDEPEEEYGVVVAATSWVYPLAQYRVVGAVH